MLSDFMLLEIEKSKKGVNFLWGVTDGEVGFGYIENELIRHCVAVCQTDSTGLSVYRDVRVVYISNLEG